MVELIYYSIVTELHLMLLGHLGYFGASIRRHEVHVQEGHDSVGSCFYDGSIVLGREHRV